MADGKKTTTDTQKSGGPGVKERSTNTATKQGSTTGKRSGGPGVKRG